MQDGFQHPSVLALKKFGKAACDFWGWGGTARSTSQDLCARTCVEEQIYGKRRDRRLLACDWADQNSEWCNRPCELAIAEKAARAGASLTQEDAEELCSPPQRGRGAQMLHTTNLDKIQAFCGIGSTSRDSLFEVALGRGVAASTHRTDLV